MEKSLEDQLQEVRTKLDAKEFDDAFRGIRGIIRYPAPALDDDAIWQRAWTLFSEVSFQYVGGELAPMIEPILANRCDLKALYDLGYQLVEYGLHGIAATPLQEANRLYPNHEGIVSELSAALEGAGLYPAAFLTLRDAAQLRENSYLCRYLYAFNGIMSGQLAEAQATFPTLDNPPDDTFAYMRQRIERMLNRADKVTGICKLDDFDLRGWHYIITGGILTHLSPYGLEDAMRGRYAYIQDNYEVVRESVEKMALILEEWEMKVPEVYYFPDRSSEAFGKAMARRLKVPALPWSMAEIESPGLVVAYDLNRCDTSLLEPLTQYRSGQLLFAHGFNWTVELPLTPDFSTMLYQMLISPWDGGGMRMNPDTNEPETTEADDAPVDELVDKIFGVEEEPDTMEDTPFVLKLVKATGPPPEKGLREKFFFGGPVPSSRFD